jgi:hypothetical protein
MPTRLVPIGPGWARNQVNTVIFRHSALVSHGGLQYAAYYDAESRVTLAQRRLDDTAWRVVRAPYSGRTADAHNAISIAVDGDGYLHMAWGNHNGPLQYCRSVAPGALELTAPLAMIGADERRVTYPEFYALPGGDLLFLYRDGASGNGNLLLDRYLCAERRWVRVQDNLLGGEGARSAYWQMAVDRSGALHLSWVWREDPDVATNHDLCYAASPDGGVTWQTSDGAPCRLPITAATAEYACRIPQGSELINQTSICADDDGRPYIATYWRPEGSSAPQYQLVFHDGRAWNVAQVGRRTTPFTLRGTGTRRTPIARPQLVVASGAGCNRAIMLFRDIERGERVSAAVCADLSRPAWQFLDLADLQVGLWEPNYDPALWAERRQLHLLVQRVGQGDGEALVDMPPQLVSVREWAP